MPADVPPPDVVPLDVVPLDVGDDRVAAALVDLQRRAYSVEAALIGHDGIPQLAETVAQLRSAGLCWLGVTGDAGLPVAAIAYSWAGDVLDVERLVVHPDLFHRGLASRLLVALPSARVTVVSTGRDNTPAQLLYQGLGFVHVEDIEVAPGLWVSRLSRPG